MSSHASPHCSTRRTQSTAARRRIGNAQRARPHARRARGGSLTPLRAARTLAAHRVVPGASLLNHSCSPNAAKAHGSHFSVEVYAVQDIAEGEDVTLCYTPITGSLSDRRGILQKHFGFFCEARGSFRGFFLVSCLSRHLSCDMRDSSKRGRERR